MGAIEGIVKNANNIAIEDYSIVIVAGPSHQDIASLTNADGKFAISNLKAGHYIIKVYGEVESDFIPVEVIGDQIAFVEIWLDVDSDSVQDFDNVDRVVIDEVNSYEDNSSGILATKWNLRSIKTLGAKKSQGTENNYILDFKANNRYYINTDVNQCEGNYMTESGGRIYFELIACTEASGDSEFADKILYLLPNMTHYEIKKKLLVLKGKGEIVLTRYFD